MTVGIEKRILSEKIYQKSLQVMPGGVNSPVRAFSDLNLLPMVAKSAHQDLVFDVDDNEYIDFCQSWGALILGHAHGAVVEDVIEAVHKSSSFGITTEIEAKIAEKIVQHMSSIEKIRFVCSGTEATMTALRLARGYTKKNKIVKFNGHYHGHLDALLIQAGSGVGIQGNRASSQGISEDVVKNTLCVEFNDINQVQKLFKEQGSEIAAVILEPIAGNMGVIPGTKEFLQVLREETTKVGALLIFDEVITGFRVALKGASELYGIKPDLSCLGKIIGGGFPVGAVGGKKEIMDFLAPLGDVYQAGTLSGNPVAMAAGYRTLLEIEKEGFYEELQKKIDFVMQPIQDFIKSKNINCSLNAKGSMFSLFFGIQNPQSRKDLKHVDKDLFRKFYHFLFERGVYLSPSHLETCFIGQAHTRAHLVKTRDLILEFLEEI